MRVLLHLVILVGIAAGSAGCGKPAAPSTSKPLAAPPPPTTAQPQASRDPSGATQSTPAPAPPAAATLDPAQEAAILAPVTAALATFQQVHKSVPNNLDELVAKGTLKGLPPVPAGWKIYYDPITVTVSIARAK